MPQCDSIDNMLLRGCVVHGLGLGRTLGYPTANLDCGPGARPESGVYAARTVCEGVAHDSVVIVGAREEAGQALVEVLLLDVPGDLYGKELAVEILEKVSGIEKFHNDDDLIKKIRADIIQAKISLRVKPPPRRGKRSNLSLMMSSPTEIGNPD